MADDEPRETINWRLVFNHYLATGTPNQLYRDDFIALRDCGAFSPSLKQREFDDILKDAWSQVPESCLKKTEHGLDWILPRDAQLGEGADANYLLEEVLKELHHVTADWVQQREKMRIGSGSENTGHGIKEDQKDTKHGGAGSPARRMAGLAEKLVKVDNLASADCKAAEDKIETLRGQKVELEAKIETAEANYNALLKAHEELKNKVEASESWTAERQELTKKIEGLEKDLKDGKASYDKMVEVARQKIGDLHRAGNEEMEKCKEEKEALAKKLRVAEEQHTTAMQELTKKLAEVERACQISKSQMEKDNKTLQTEINSHRNTKLLLESIGKGTNSEKERKMLEEMKVLKEQLSTKNEERQQATDMTGEKVGKAESAADWEMDGLRAANEILAAEVEKLKAGIRTFDQNTTLMDERETKLVREASENATKIDSMQEELKKVQDENRQLESRVEKVSREAKANIDQLEITIKALTSSKKNAELTSHALKQDMKLKGRNDQQQTQDEQKKQAMERFIEKKAMKELETKLKSSETANADLKKQFKTQAQQHEQKQTELEGRIARRDASIQKLKSQIEELSVSHQSRQQASSSSVLGTNNKAAIERLQAEVKSTKFEIQQLKSNLNMQMQRIGRRDATIKQLKEKLHDVNEHSGNLEEAWKRAEERADACESKLEFEIKLKQGLEAELLKRMTEGESSSAVGNGDRGIANDKNTAGTSRSRAGPGHAASHGHNGVPGSSDPNELKAMKKQMHEHSHAYAKDGSPLLERVGKTNASEQDEGESSDEEDDEDSAEENEDGE